MVLGVGRAFQPPHIRPIEGTPVIPLAPGLMVLGFHRLVPDLQAFLLHTPGDERIPFACATAPREVFAEEQAYCTPLLCFLLRIVLPSSSRVTVSGVLSSEGLFHSPLPVLLAWVRAFLP